GDDGLDALLLDGAQAVGRDAQRHPPLLRLHPEALRMQVRQEAAALLVVRVGDAVTDGGLLASDLADPGHTKQPWNSVGYGRRGGVPPRRVGLYTSPAPPDQCARASPKARG